MKCYCGKDVGKERESLNMKTCISCSNTSKDICYTEYGGKTAGYLVRINGSDKEQQRIAKRSFRRAR